MKCSECLLLGLLLGEPLLLLLRELFFLRAMCLLLCELVSLFLLLCVPQRELKLFLLLPHLLLCELFALFLLLRLLLRELLLLLLPCQLISSLLFMQRVRPLSRQLVVVCLRPELLVCALQVALLRQHRPLWLLLLCVLLLLLMLLLLLRVLPRVVLRLRRLWRQVLLRCRLVVVLRSERREARHECCCTSALLLELLRCR